MKYLLIYILAFIIAAIGLLSSTHWIMYDHSYFEIKTWIIYLIAYFVAIKPLIDYWYFKIYKVMNNTDEEDDEQ